MKSKENEYNKLHESLHGDLNKQEKVLSQVLGQIRQVKSQIEQTKKLKTNSDGQNLGYDRLNQLTASLKSEEQKTKDLGLDIKSMQRINTEQHNEIDRIEDTMGYNSKIEGLLQELQTTNAKNEDLRQKVAHAQSKSREHKIREITQHRRYELMHLGEVDLKKLMDNLMGDIEELQIASSQLKERPERVTTSTYSGDYSTIQPTVRDNTAYLTNKKNTTRKLRAI